MATEQFYSCVGPDADEDDALIAVFADGEQSLNPGH